MMNRFFVAIDHFSSQKVSGVLLNRLDQAAAGFGNSVTFGGTNWVREKLYGETATQNHQGGFYQGGEFAGDLATSALPTGAFNGAKWSQRAVSAYNKARNIFDRFQDVSSKVGSINNILNGCGGLEDLQNLAGNSLNPLRHVKQPSTVLGINARDPRNFPGTVQGGSNLPVIGNRWLRGSDGNIGLIPKQIGEQLSGNDFNDFRRFREAFWQTVARDPNLASQFNRSNQTRMAKGLAPIAPKSQHLGKQKSYTIHHKTPIQHGGGVYDLDNVIVVTPRFHKEILDGSYHYGSQ